jgi:hypothetical protein
MIIESATPPSVETLVLGVLRHRNASVVIETAIQRTKRQFGQLNRLNSGKGKEDVLDRAVVDIVTLNVPGATPFRTTDGTDVTQVEEAGAPLQSIATAPVNPPSGVNWRSNLAD